MLKKYSVLLFVIISPIAKGQKWLCGAMLRRYLDGQSFSIASDNLAADGLNVCNLMGRRSCFYHNVGVILHYVLARKCRLEKIKEFYKDESEKEKAKGKRIAITYWVFTPVFFAISLALTRKRYLINGATIH